MSDKLIGLIQVGVSLVLAGLLPTGLPHLVLYTKFEHRVITPYHSHITSHHIGNPSNKSKWTFPKAYFGNTMQVWSLQAGYYPHNECLDTPHAYGVLKNMV